MLVLTRKLNESILIGPDIVVKVLHIERRGAGVIKLGIEAPKDMRVDREEVRRDMELNPRKEQP